MKKKALSLALALVMCLGLTVPVLAVETTTIKDDAGYSYTLSQPVIGSYVTKDNNAKDVTVYQIPEGTIITPISPEGKEYDRTSLKNLGLGLGHMMEKEQGLKQAGADIDPDRAERTTNFFVVYQEVEPDDSGNMHALHGLWDYSEDGEEVVETQPFPVGEHLIRREIRWIYLGNSEGGSTIPPALGTGGDSYLYVEVVSKSQPTTPVEPEQPGGADITVDKIPAKGTAVASTQSVELDGKKVEFQMYALKDEKGSTNYIKLRDLGHILNGTKAQFNVGYSKETGITVTTGQAYQGNGSEMNTPFSGDRAYAGGGQSVQINGKAVELTAFVLTDDAGGGYTYFKLRDLGAALGFNVSWSADRGVYVETDKPYVG